MASYAKDLQPPGDANHYIVKAIKDELSPDTRPAQEIARVTAPQQVQPGLLPPNYVEATRQ